MIQTFEFYGTGRQINATGRFFRYEQGAEGAGLTAIKLTIDGNRVGQFEPGDALELPSGATRWDIEPVSSGCVGVVRIGNVRITSDKLQGTVSVVESGRARSLNQVAYSAHMSVTTAASQFACVELWNKAGSGKRLIVTGVRVATSAASVVRMYGVAVQKSAPGFTSPAIAKRLGSARSTACDLYGWRAATPEDLPAGDIMGFMAGVNQAMVYEPVEPVVIGPGNGIYMAADTATVTLNAAFDWYEESV